MRILAIDTSLQSVSVALFDGGEFISELDSERNDGEGVNAPSSPPVGGRAGSGDEMAPGFTKKRSKRGSKTSRLFPPGASVMLAPMIESLMDRANWALSEVGLIAIATGPGRFTGLRVGVVTAKTLAYATGAQIIGVNTLEVIAGQTAIESHAFGKTIQTVVNAQRGQLFSGGFVFEKAWQIGKVVGQQIVGQQAWIESLHPGDLVSGAGLKPIVETIRSTRPDIAVAPENCWASSAVGVGKLAWQKYQLGQRDDLWTIEPLYFRPSSAEEVRAKTS